MAIVKLNVNLSMCVINRYTPWGYEFWLYNVQALLMSELNVGAELHALATAMDTPYLPGMAYPL
jgi:hypothetical protein